MKPAGTKREVALTVVFLAVLLAEFLAVDSLVPISVRLGVVAGWISLASAIVLGGLRRFAVSTRVAILVLFAAVLVGTGWVDVSGKPAGRKEFARKLYGLPGMTRSKARAAMAGYWSRTAPDRDMFQYSATEADVGIVNYDGDRVASVDWDPD